MIKIITNKFASQILSHKVEGTRSMYLILKTKDRNALKSSVEAFLKLNKLAYAEVSTSKSGFPCTRVDNVTIVYKPNISKGAGGKAFEVEFAKDLHNLIQCSRVDDAEFHHPDVMKELVKILPSKVIKDKTAKIILEGDKNQKRVMTFVGGKFILSNSTGEILTDVTLNHMGSNHYFSLKMSKTYYLVNASVFQIFKDKSKQKAAYEFFGLDGIKMGAYDGLMGHTDPIYYCQTKPISQQVVKSNIQGLIQEAMGSGYYFVHKKQTDSVTCFHNDGNVDIIVKSIDSMVYPEQGVRKYTAIKTQITVDGSAYTCTLQFRGTKETDLEPKYLRMLMEKK